MAPKKIATEAKKDDKPEEESKKRKAEAKADAKAEAKKVAKKEAKKEEVKEEAEPKEKEQDAPVDKRASMKQTVTFEANSCTLNVLPTLGGKVLNSLQDGGMQYLVAGARANVGIQSGRYMFEVRVIEALSPTDTSGGRGRPPLPRQLLRIGFSTASASLILGDDEESVCFDAQGSFTSGKTTSPSLSQRFGKDMVVACILNLDEKSPNFNTVSLFKHGERICEPQALPDSLKGKPLFPHVSFRNVTLQLNFGNEPLTALPFKCRMVQSAAQADVTVTPPMAPKDGKYEVIFPVSFPDQGSFSWLDIFLEKHPHYVELSDRKIVEWAEKSGMWKPKAGGFKNSLDKPEFNYGLPSMDDLSVRRVLSAVAPLVPRNYIVMEVKENLVADDRKSTLKRFNHPSYRKVANVFMGEPTDAYKASIHDRLLKAKKDKAEADWKAKKLEKERKKQLEVKQKQLAALRKKADDEKQKAKEEAEKKFEEARKKAQEEAAKKAAEEAKEGGEKAEGEDAAAKTEGEAKKADEVKDEEVKQETKEEVKEETKEEVKEETKDEKEEEEEDEPMPEVELTEEEKKAWFPKQEVPDLTPQVLNQAFGKFTVPEKSEGFDEVRFEWDKKEKATQFLRSWVLNRKVTAKVEDLEPSEWFKSKYSTFEKKLKEWQEIQKPLIKKKEDRKKKGEDEDDKSDDIDIFSVNDVVNVGNGDPLFKDFGFEDWALLSLRYELFLLSHAFMKDVDDEERVGIHESNLNFYYNKYYKKTLNPKYYGKDTNAGLIEFVKDTVVIEAEKSVLSSQLADDADSLDIFVKLTEESRRERQRRIDAGDETARLQFSVLMTQQTLPKAAAKVQGAAPDFKGGWKGKGGYMSGKGGYGGKW